jgi:hypothetical protein
MQLTKAGIALGFTVLLGACAGAQKPAAPSVAHLDCRNVDHAALAQVYAPTNVKQVETLYRTEFRARAIQARFVHGAAIHVPAQPGMNAAYVQRALSCHAVQGGAVDGPDPLRVAGVERIRVSEQGAMMRIAVTSSDHSTAKEIAKQAKQFAESRGEVRVEQLSAATAERASF